MSVRDFIRQNRVTIDAEIRSIWSTQGKLNDEDRRVWLLNDEGLYRWARSLGCRL